MSAHVRFVNDYTETSFSKCIHINYVVAFIVILLFSNKQNYHPCRRSRWLGRRVSAAPRSQRLRGHKHIFAKTKKDTVPLSRVNEYISDKAISEKMSTFVTEPYQRK